MKKKMLCMVSSLFLGGLFCFGGESEVHAAPVNPNMGKVTFEQPDGKTFEGERKGDEHLNYVVADKTSDIVVQGKDNFWYYAQKGKARTGIQTSGKKYLIDEKPADTLSEKEVATLKVPIPKQIKNASNADYKLNRDQNLLVILVEYNNQKFNKSAYSWGMREESSVEQWQQKVFGVGNENKSVKEYYTEATQDRINLLPAQTSQFASAPGVIKVSLDEDHPNSDGTQKNPDTLYMERALKKAEEHIDLSAYDKNKDGKLETNELHVMFIVAGFEMTNSSATRNAVWAHKSFAGLSSKNGSYFDNGYFVVGEKMMVHYEKKYNDGMVLSTSIDVPLSIGAIAHEFGHDLGLPDLYGPNTVDGGGGLGYHSVMSSGMWGGHDIWYSKKSADDSGALPAHFDAYSKMKLGFPVETVENEREVTAMDGSHDEFKVYKLPIYKENKRSEEEYYLIENRQIFGFDEGRRAYNGSEGISLYHVNENYPNNLNISNYGDQLVTLKEADESINGYPLLSKEKGDDYSSNSYFKKGSNNIFSVKTVPSSVTKEGGYPHFSVSVEDEKNEIMKIKFENTQPIKGTYGTSAWYFDKMTNILTFEDGVFPNTSNSMTIRDVIESQFNGEKIKKIVIAGDNVKLTTGNSLFANLNDLESIEGLEKLNTRGVTSMRMMFFGSKSIQTLNVSNFDTSNVVDMSSMFYGDSDLTTLNMSGWNTINVRDMQMMFYGLSKIQHLDVSNFDTGNVGNMSDMFTGLTNITNLDVTNLDTSNVVYMSRMFDSLPNLTSLDLSNFITGKVTHMHQMFYGATKLKELDLSSFDTRRTKNMADMFYNCQSLETLNLSNFVMRNTIIGGMFHGCSSLDTLVLGKGSLLHEKNWNVELESKTELPYSDAWMGPDNTIMHSSTSQFIGGYNGTKPGIYTRERIN
ncbi:BspA family leucine-rich repeat surface protein [Enterococcus ureasiticus]|uniref:EF-hand domain-containing protein n=1 Tax=Enterococcus ureasiticus TaxID=903984 RepID=A0A1E5GCA8_9ENTE|nr:BspA family leucine-rich repeat surface protein [Enterococcus ureasiticus]OEG10297.1 hypothetical protein BCR21_13175 [Enterococcus ureasiticus]